MWDPSTLEELRVSCFRGLLVCKDFHTQMQPTAYVPVETMRVHWVALGMGVDVF